MQLKSNTFWDPPFFISAALQSPRMRPRVILELNVPPPNTSFVISDSVLLLQYLSNLLSNGENATSIVVSSVLCILQCV
jgi:signal transduction histidine kinase